MRVGQKGRGGLGFSNHIWYDWSPAVEWDGEMLCQNQVSRFSMKLTVRSALSHGYSLEMLSCLSGLCYWTCFFKILYKIYIGYFTGICLLFQEITARHICAVLKNPQASSRILSHTGWYVLMQNKAKNKISPHYISPFGCLFRRNGKHCRGLRCQSPFCKLSSSSFRQTFAKNVAKISSEILQMHSQKTCMLSQSTRRL